MSYRGHEFFNNGKEPNHEQDSHHLPTLSNEYLNDLSFWQQAERNRKRTSYKGYIIGGAFILLLILLWLVYKTITSPPTGQPVVISPPQTTYRVQPEDRGGVHIPHQDKYVYNRIDPYHHQEPEARIVEQPQIPQEPEKLILGYLNPKTGEFVPKSEPEPTPPKQKNLVPPENVDQPKEFNDLLEEVMSEEGINFDAVQETYARPAEKNKFYVELGALESKMRAQQEWRRLAMRYKTELRNQPYIIKPASNSKRKNFYRLLMGPFETRHLAFKKASKLGSSCRIVEEE